MKKIPSIVPALAEHIPLIVANMRQADIDEMALLGLLPTEAVEYSLKTSRFACTGFIDSEVVCIFGICPSPVQGLGRPWMMATEKLEQNAMIFLRRCRPQVEKMLECFPYLENYVSASNQKAIEWLGWLRFSFSKSEPYGMFGAEFIKFYRGRI